MNAAPWLMALALASVGCTKVDGTANAPDASAPCAKVGQRCEFAPGKFGSCVQKDECPSGDCFVCQSQH